MYEFLPATRNSVEIIIILRFPDLNTNRPFIKLEWLTFIVDSVAASSFVL